MISSTLIYNSLIMAILLTLSIGFIWLVIRKIAGKGIISKLSGMTLLAVAIDCELAFILGQIGMSVFNVIIIFGPGITITLLIIYMMHKIVVVPVQNLIGIGKNLAVGDLSNDVPYESNDEIGELAGVVRNIISYQRSISSSAKKIVNGEINVDIKSLSEKDELSQSFHILISTLTDLTSEIKLLTKSAIEGKLSSRGNETKFNGSFKEIVEGLNKTLDAVILPVKEGSDVLEDMAKGDLSIRVKGDYKGDHEIIKRSINQLGDSMNHALSDVKEAIQATASAANEIFSSSELMAAGNLEQSQKTNEIAGAIEQMTTTIIDSSQYVIKAAENSVLASNTAKAGAQKVVETKNGMLRIVDSTKITGAKIASLAGKTEQIGEITQVIDDIADQTNLLALNAAIEAARAGEQGRGFAVVADEVRKLAERTTKATKEIADTIKAIQDEAKEADSSMATAKIAVENGMKLTEEVAVALNSILNVNQVVSDIVAQVASSSEEQSSGAEEISKNIELISNVTEQNAQGSGQIAKAAEDLNRLTHDLKILIEQFKLETATLPVHKNIKALTY